MLGGYQAFAETLRAGGFGEPDTGWNASQIGAHIAVSNELFSELAERMRGGEDISFDNSAATDDAGLLAYAAKLGGTADLAGTIETTAARLAQAYERLTREQRTRPIPARIWSDGQLVVDRPMPLGDLIVGNGEGHLGGHHEQLRALLTP
jgi:hypothetical protein